MALVVVDNHQPDATQAARRRRAQGRLPEDLGLPRASCEA